MVIFFCLSQIFRSVSRSSAGVPNQRLVAIARSENCTGYVMRCAAVVIIVAALSTARATATANGRADDGSEIVAETAQESHPQMTEYATPRDPPLRGLLYPRESESREASILVRKFILIVVKKIISQNNFIFH